MRFSKYFMPLLKETPSDAQIASHRLMLRSGMIKLECAGIYSWLPLGLRVMRNIENIVRKNMNLAGAIELLMPCIQTSSLWQESGRYNDYGPEMLRITDRHDNELLFGPTNEELITDIFRSSVKSYKDLPKNLYHIQWKFRDEIRPRFGVMRGREFLMKDAYTFDIDKESALRSYDSMYLAYINSFKEMGLTAIPVKGDSGPIGGEHNHEFHIVAETGESTIFYDPDFTDELTKDNIDIKKLQSLYSATDDLHDENVANDKNLKTTKGIEVGHIFYFGTKYSDPMKALVNSQNGELIPVQMGSYGIGVTRVIAAAIEANHDDKGIIWPMAIAPFKVAIINLAINDDLCNSAAENLYQSLSNNGIDVIYDDSDERPGTKFAANDLIGCPLQVIIGSRKIKDNILELKNRRTGVVADYNVTDILNIIINTVSINVV